MRASEPAQLPTPPGSGPARPHQARPAATPASREPRRCRRFARLTRPAAPRSGGDQVRADARHTARFTTGWREDPYLSDDYTQTLADHDVLASVGSTGDAYDNAMAESFVDSFKTELIADRVWRTRSLLELAIVEYIAWFNDSRLHEALEDRPPREVEELYAVKARATTPTR